MFASYNNVFTNVQNFKKIKLQTCIYKRQSSICDLRNYKPFTAHLNFLLNDEWFVEFSTAPVGGFIRNFTSQICLTGFP
jgi:hypothetical protein